MDVESLVVEHTGWIRKRALRYYSNEQDADDLASETIYKCLSNADKYNPSRSFKPWVIAIMENTYITQYNRRKCVLFTGYDDYDSCFGNEHADQLASVNSILSIIHECNRKSRCIECVLLYAEGYSYDEIAIKTGIPEGTVKSRISAGRKMLRKAVCR